MPKVVDTRKQRAEKLLALIKQGPISIRIGPRAGRDAYDLWVETWILSELKQLIPELKVRSK